MAERRLARSRTHRRIAGVCGGLASYFDTDPVFVRLGFVASVFIPPFAAAAIVGYLAAWIIVPEEEEPAAAPGVPAGVAGPNPEEDFGATQAIVPPPAGMPPPGGTAGSEAPQRPLLPADASLVGGLIFVALGLFFLALNLGLLPWEITRFWRWKVLWPVAVIVVGAALLVRAIARANAPPDGR